MKMPAALLCAWLALPAAAAPAMSDYAGLWSGDLAGFKGKYSVTFSLSALNGELYGSYRVLRPRNEGEARGGFVLVPDGDCWKVRINAFGEKEARSSRFCQRPDGGVAFYIDLLGGAASAELSTDLAGLDIIATSRQDEIKGRLKRRTPRAARAAKKTAEPKPAVMPVLNSGEKSLKTKKPPLPKE